METTVRVPENCPTINEAYTRIEQSKGALTTIVLGKGVHVVEGNKYYNYLNINCPVKIVGDPNAEKKDITVMGGFRIRENGVHVEHLTIRHKNGGGVVGEFSCTLTDLMIDQCRYGVHAVGSDAVFNCLNIMVSKCKQSGVFANVGGTIILRGNRTLITNNCLDGSNYYYGLDVNGSSSKIQIVKPLTKEAISKENNGRNWGGSGIIETIENGYKSQFVRVPGDFKTINEAYAKIEQSSGALTTIVLGPGNHVVKGGGYLNINCPVNIVGDPNAKKETITVLGGFKITVNGVHVEHLTIRHENGYGVDGKKSSCNLSDLMIDQCGQSGVHAGSDAVLNCLNIMVRMCQYSGVVAWKDGTIILRGNRTMITDNCLKRSSASYGLVVYGPSSKIQIVKPLTKESISKYNNGQNWGAFNNDATLDQIETIKNGLITSSFSYNLSKCVRVPEDCKTIIKAYELIQQSKESNGALTTIVLSPGDHVVEEDEYGENYLNIKCPVNIVGSRDVLDKSKIVVVGGFKITANGVHVEHLTIRHKKGYGVWGESSCTLTDLMIHQCGNGVYAKNSAVLNCTNIMVSKCRYSGVCASEGGTIILSGNLSGNRTRTEITGNCLDGYSWDYGLVVYGPSSKIQIVNPLNKEAISKKNNGGRNLGAYNGATLDQIETIDISSLSNSLTTSELINDAPSFSYGFSYDPSQVVRVPEDCNTILKAYKKIQQSKGALTTIVLGPGYHDVGKNYLDIDYRVNIVGSRYWDKSKIVVEGGFLIRANGVHVEHLTIHRGTHGVKAKSSCTLNDLMITDCGGCGVWVQGSDVVLNCTNIFVKKCNNSGVYASDGATIILRGRGTLITDNCYFKKSELSYGLAADPYSKIQIVKPLTKEAISKGNKGGRNWGAWDEADINQIEIIESEVSGETKSGETKSGETEGPKGPGYRIRFRF